MTKQLLDRKTHFIGEWHDDVVTGDQISQINSSVQNEKGSKVRLQLYVDGLRVVKSGLMMGKTLQEFIPFPDMYYLTVSKRTPNFLFVIAKGRKKKYMIQGFRCANGLDAGMFLENFRSVKVERSRGQKINTDVSSPGVGLNAKIKSHDGINWTLRDKEQDMTKRELKQLLDVHGEKALVEKNSEIKNGHGSPGSGGAHLYRKGKPQLQKAPIEVEQVLPNGEISDIHSESDNVSESALRVELESLSQELRDIKLMLEKSTGLTPDHKQTVIETRTVTAPVGVRTTTITQKSATMKGEALDAVVLDDDDDYYQPQRRQNGTEHDAGVIRVSVPDYRSVGERTSVDQTRPSTKRDASSGYGSVTSRTSTTSYENWKRHTTSVPNNDMQERLQWRSRTTVHPRPRSTMASWSSDATDSSNVQMRVVRPQSYRVVAVDPRRRTVDKAHRPRAFSTTVARSIEKVYRRPEVAHNSLVYRPQSGSGRPTILANGSVRSSRQFENMEPNNNFVKVDSEEHQLLDVSGVDLDRETPRETIIRT